MNDTVDERKQRDLVLLVYVLQTIGFFVGLTWIAGVVLNYMKRDEVVGTWMQSHFDWQIKTFWVGLIVSIIGVLTTWILIGWPLLLAVWVWCVYRVVRGWLALNDHQPLHSGFF